MMKRAERGKGMEFWGQSRFEHSIFVSCLLLLLFQVSLHFGSERVGRGRGRRKVRDKVEVKAR